jgi:hypothetical protein
MVDRVQRAAVRTDPDDSEFGGGGFDQVVML